jgi:hypothetical protein
MVELILSNTGFNRFPFNIGRLESYRGSPVIASQLRYACWAFQEYEKMGQRITQEHERKKDRES